MFKIIDWYIIRKFLGTFFFAILLIISVAVIFDATERLDDFIEKDAPIKNIIFDYYLNFIPYFANLFSNLILFIAVIFFTSNLSSNTEIIAILSSGVSFRRLMLPYIISAAILALFSFSLSNFVIPPANKVRLAFTEKYLKNPFNNFDRNIHRQVQPGEFVYMESYNVNNQVGYKFSIEKFNEGRLVSKLLSDYVKWDNKLKKWRVFNYYIRNIDGMKETISRGQTIDTVFYLTPDDFNKRVEIVEAMNFSELNRYIKEQKMFGTANIDLFLIEKYRRTSFPFSAFILTIIGASIASRKTKGGTGLHIGVGILISFSYILFMQVSSQFAIGGDLNPLLAVWLPNIIFAFISVFVYYFTPK